MTPPPSWPDRMPRCNAELVRKGFAWVFPGGCKKPFCNEWLNWEQRARQDKIGLWSEDNPVSPRAFRRKRSRNRAGRALIKSYLKPVPE